MTDKVGKKILEIDNCLQCPHAMVPLTKRELICTRGDEVRYRRICGKNTDGGFTPPSIPDWCPLKDAEK